MNTNDNSLIDVILQVEQNQNDLYFMKDNRKYRKLYLWGTEEEEYHIGDDPISESLSPWVELSVLRNENGEKTSLDISGKWYGLKPDEESAVKALINQVRLALSNGTSLSVKLNLVFNLSEWIPTLE